MGDAAQAQADVKKLMGNMRDRPRRNGSTGEVWWLGTAGLRTCGDLGRGHIKICAGMAIPVGEDSG